MNKFRGLNRVRRAANTQQANKRDAMTYYIQSGYSRFVLVTESKKICY